MRFDFTKVFGLSKRDEELIALTRKVCELRSSLEKFKRLNKKKRLKIKELEARLWLSRR